MIELLEKIKFYEFYNSLKGSWRVCSFVKKTAEGSLTIIGLNELKNNGSLTIYKNFTKGGYVLDKDCFINSTNVVDKDAFAWLTYAKVKNPTKSINLFRKNQPLLTMVDEQAKDDKGELIYRSDGKPLMTNKLYHITKLIPNYRSGKKQIKRDVVEIYNEELDINLKCLVEDLEFIYPDINKLTKGIKEPLNRTKRIGANIKVTSAKRNAARLPNRTKGVIKELITAGNKKYCVVSIGDKLHKIEQSKIRVIK